MTSIRAMAIGAALAGLIGGPAAAETVLKWAHVYEVATPYHEAALWASEQLKERTNGEYSIEVFPASSLGKEVAINEGLDLGTVDIIYTGVAFIGNTYPPIAISDYPYTLRDIDHWRTYRDSELFDELKKGYTEIAGHEIMGFTYYGQRHVTANKPIMKPEDMEGLKIRVPNAKAYMAFPEQTGANPTPMAFSEVYLALQQGVVDAQENPLPTIKFKKFYEVQEHINLTGHITNSLVTIVSNVTLSQMDDETRAILKDVITEAAERATNEIVKQENELAEWFREQGVTVNVVDREPFIEALRPYLTGPDVPWDAEIYERMQAL